MMASGKTFYLKIYIKITSQEWRPRWGFKRAQDETKDWLIEIPQSAGSIGYVDIHKLLNLEQKLFVFYC